MSFILWLIKPSKKTAYSAYTSFKLIDLPQIILFFEIHFHQQLHPSQHKTVYISTSHGKIVSNMRLLSSIATSFTILSLVPIVHCNPQVPSRLADTVDHDPNSISKARELQMDKPWGEMQKGSESKQVIDRELKKVSTLGLCSLVVCFALHTINSPSHPP